VVAPNVANALLEEPDALIALVRVRGGVGGQPPALPGNGSISLLFPRSARWCLESRKRIALSNYRCILIGNRKRAYPVRIPVPSRCSPSACISRRILRRTLLADRWLAPPISRSPGCRRLCQMSTMPRHRSDRA
jgi:hypothetical protein